MGALIGLAMLIALEVPGDGVLRWRAPAGDCPDAAAVEQRMEGLIGTHALQARAEAHVGEIDGRWRAELTLHWEDHTDRRILEAEDCASLAEATALVVAVMADPLTATTRVDASMGPRAQPSPPEPATRARPVRSPVEAPVEPEGARAAARTKGAPAARSTGPAVGVALLLDGGTLPRVTPGPLLTTAWRTSWVRLLLEGYLLPPRRVRSTQPDADGQLLMGAARVGGCVRLAPAPRALLPLCAAAEVGGARAWGFGAAGTEGARDLWLAGSTRMQLVIPLGRALALTAGAEMTMPVRRIDYRLRGERLHRTADVALRGFMGIEVGRMFAPKN